jgi:hypothetical protein
MADKDEILLDEIEFAFRSAYRRYRRANPVEQEKLFTELQQAAKEWVVAQSKLVETDERATQQMIAEMREIKQSVDDAADTSELLIAYGRLLAFLIAL